MLHVVCYAPLPAMENMVGRISPTVVFIKSKLYIFGGNRDFGDSINPDPCFSYSIANILLEEKGWTWEVIDVPYEEPAKSLVFAYAIPIYNDKKNPPHTWSSHRSWEQGKYYMLLYTVKAYVLTHFKLSENAFSRWKPNHLSHGKGLQEIPKTRHRWRLPPRNKWLWLLPGVYYPKTSSPSYRETASSSPAQTSFPPCFTGHVIGGPSWYSTFDIIFDLFPASSWWGQPIHFYLCLGALSECRRTRTRSMALIPDTEGRDCLSQDKPHDLSFKPPTWCCSQDWRSACPHGISVCRRSWPRYIGPDWYWRWALCGGSPRCLELLCRCPHTTHLNQLQSSINLTTVLNYFLLLPKFILLLHVILCVWCQCLSLLDWFAEI